MQRDISDEIRVQWLVSLKDLPEWVRQASVDLIGREGLKPEELFRLRAGEENLVYGYAELSDSATPEFIDDEGNECFNRRYFYVRSTDQDSKGYKDNGRCPTEAAAPGSIEPGVWGLSPYKKSQITVRVSPLLLWRLNAYTQRQKISLSELVLEAIECYLNRDQELSLDKRVEELERKMEIVLQKLNF